MSNMTVELELEGVKLLSKDLGKDIHLLFKVILVALQDERVIRLKPPDDELQVMKTRPDGKALFLKYLETRTGRQWSLEEMMDLWEAVNKLGKKGLRQPIKFEDWLKLYWNAEEKCHECHKTPPEVTLVIDHREPVKRHGESKYDNLQFLCVKCNWAKGGKSMEVFRWHKK